MIVQKLINTFQKALSELYEIQVNYGDIQIQNTKSDFEGDFTFVVFPYVKAARKSPEAVGQEIGSFLSNQLHEIENFNIVKGFLNITIHNLYWITFANESYQNTHFGFQNADKHSKPVVIEFSSPNTNKPLHLGHIRNNLLGFSLSRIIAASGKKVVKVNLVNDRGIHICKSMLAWQKWGNGETPASSGMKGDHLVGKYYVIFDQKLKEQVNEMRLNGVEDEEANRNAPLMKEAQQLLQLWEAGDLNVRNLWENMNGWVYNGFDETYKLLGIEFDKTYYESNTYLLGKAIVEEGLKCSVFDKHDDGSVWIDLTPDGLDQKLLLRSDGTSVYITQDLGTAQQRYEEYSPEQLIYVVGNEQEYHFSVLKLVLKHLNREWYNCIHHLSYGMVELPAGKMKSREGTVVDADDLMKEMFDTSESVARELGKLDNFDNEYAQELYRTIGLGALKYFILKVDPRRNMLFNPSESIDFNGNTGPFIQYTHARIKSVLRKAENELSLSNIQLSENTQLNSIEKELLKRLHDFPSIIQQAAEQYSPALIANYAYEIAGIYNRFYHDYSILKEENIVIKQFRLVLSSFTALVISKSMWLLGINVPEKM